MRFLVHRSILLLGLLAVLALPACGEDVVSEAGDEPVKGPDPGMSGNDSDNPFRSLTVSPTDPDIIYMGSEGSGIFKSTDGGVTWEWQRDGLKHFATEQRAYPEIYEMVIDPRDESVVYAATTSGPGPAKGDYPSTAAGVYKSVDGGATWAQMNRGLPNSAVNSIVLDPESGTLYIGLDGEDPSYDFPVDVGEIPGGIFMSTDDGESWQALPIPEGGLTNRFKKLVLGTDGHTLTTSGVRYMESETGIYPPDLENSLGIIRSTDGGESWRQIDPGTGFFLYFDTSADGAVIYGNDQSEAAIWASYDSGTDWRRLQTFGSGPIAISPHAKKRVLFSGGNFIGLSIDGMVSHTRVLEVAKPITDIAFSPSDPDVVYISMSGLILFKSIDGGWSFTKVANLREFIDSQTV